MCNIKRIVAIMSTIVLMFSITACGKNENDDSSSQPQIKVREQTLETKKEDSEVEETPENMYVPNVDINFTEENGLNLSQFSITAIENDESGWSSVKNKYNYDVSDLNLEKIVNDLGLEKNDYYSTITSTDKFYYTAIGYEGRMNPDSNNSVFPIEIEINEQVVDDYNTTNMSGYTVKGIKFVKDFMNTNDYELSIMNEQLKFGMTREDVIKEFGEGATDEENRVYYKVVDATLVVEFSSNEVVTIYLIKN